MDKDATLKIVIIFLVILTIIRMIVTIYKYKLLREQRKLNEGYINKYLYPLQDLQEICEKKGLEPSYMPRVCYKSDGSYDPYSNCECIDKDGMCATCYKPLKRYELNAGVIYDSLS